MDTRTSGLRSLWIGLWEGWRELAAVLHPCRFSLFVIVAGAAFLLLSPQGAEVAVRLPDEPFWWRGLLFHLCVFVWAFESWYWARVLLHILFSEDRSRNLKGETLSSWQQVCVAQVPRLLAIFAYVVPCVALFKARATQHLVIAISMGVIFYCCLVLRRWATDKVIGHSGSKRMRDLLGREFAAYSRLRDLPGLAIGILLLGFALAIVCIAFVIVDPVTFGWLFGAAAVPFLGFALIVPAGSLAVYLCHVAVARGRPQSDRSLPALTILIVWAVVGNLLADNHAVRVIPNSQPMQTQFAKAVAKWHAAAKEAYGRDDPPLIIVSAAGGGLRAAFWTATVLGALQDQDANFGKSVFAISGVSGGSLGAAVFVTLLAEPREHLEKVEACPAPERRHECMANAVLAQDFLAPAVAGLLFPDLIHKFVPVIANGHDRAAALEKGWEHAWKVAGLSDKTWKDRSFTSLWSGTNAALPALLLNGVHVATGKRIVTSNLRVSDIPLADTYDVLHDVLEVDIPVSTAVHNSARFTYVSPAGTLRQGGTGANRGRIVDGGYFENFGAATALETLNAVSDELRATKRNFRPFIIQISNDPKVEEFAPDAEPAVAASPHEDVWCRNEVLSPMCALLATRDSRGTLAYKEFLEKANGGDWSHFRLCDKVAEPALGWVLAKGSNQMMREVVRDDRCGNGKSLGRVLAFATRPASATIDK
jgi:hypothetical protein